MQRSRKIQLKMRGGAGGNQSMATESELKHMLELPNKDIIILIIIIFQMFKKLSTGTEDIEKDPSQTSIDENYNG